MSAVISKYIICPDAVQWTCFSPAQSPVKHLFFDASFYFSRGIMQEEAPDSTLRGH